MVPKPGERKGLGTHWQQRFKAHPNAITKKIGTVTLRLKIKFSMPPRLHFFLYIQEAKIFSSSHISGNSIHKFNFQVTLPVLLFRDISSVDIQAVFDLQYVLFCASAQAQNKYCIRAPRQ